MTRKQIYHLVWAIAWTALGLILSWTYRPYIYSHHLFDFHLADTIGNWVAVPAVVNFSLAVSKKQRQLWQRVLLAVVAMAVYEVLLSTFDWYDMIANLLSGLFTFLIMKDWSGTAKKDSGAV